MTSPFFIVMMFSLMINNAVIDGPNLAGSNTSFKTEIECKAALKKTTERLIAGIKQISSPKAEVKHLTSCVTDEQAKYMQMTVAQHMALKNYIEQLLNNNQI